MAHTKFQPNIQSGSEQKKIDFKVVIITDLGQRHKSA